MFSCHVMFDHHCCKQSTDNMVKRVCLFFDLLTEAVGADPEEIPAENPGEREGAAGAEEGCGDSQGEN